LSRELSPKRVETILAARHQQQVVFRGELSCKNDA
jgi:hypothetical protein